MKKILAVVALLALSACTTRTVAQNPGANPVAATLSVEAFLQAVNARNLDAMAQLFGTYEGTLVDRGVPATEVELQMDLLVEILRHQEYEIVSERMVAGREENVTRVGVNLMLTPTRRADDVAFVVVEARGGRWLIESIDTQKVTRAE